MASRDRRRSLADPLVSGRSVAVWGIGVEGCAAARYALANGAVRVVDVVDEPAADPAVWLAASGGAEVVTGTAGEQALRDADVVLRSPGISIHRPLMAELIAAGVSVTSGTAMFLRATKHLPVVAVTGSKGKSTTSALIAHLLTALGEDVIHAGNIGTPLLDLLAESAPAHYVLEVSSFQASDVDTSPSVVVLTSLFPDHIDWHGDEDTYYRDKLNLANHGPATVVANSTDVEQKRRLAGRSDVEWYATEAGWHADGRAIHWRGEAVFTLPDDQLIGRHNAANACAALTAISALGHLPRSSAEVVQEALSSFEPLAHRLSLVAVIDEVRYVDDSLATSPHAAVAALEAFADRPVTLIAGGHDRGVSYEVLARHIATREEWTAVLTLPANGPQIADELARHAKGITVSNMPDLDKAVAAAAEITPPGGVVLLSPAAPSFTQFRDYAARSAAFIAAVTALV